MSPSTRSQHSSSASKCPSVPDHNTAVQLVSVSPSQHSSSASKCPSVPHRNRAVQLVSVCLSRMKSLPLHKESLLYHPHFECWITFHGLFRQSLNGTGTGTNGFLDITVILSHCNGTGPGTGTGNLTNGFPTHSGTYMVNLQVNLQGNFNVSLWSWSRSQSRCSVKGSA